jgi:transcriptional regulator with XRE-family HTH domain
MAHVLTQDEMIFAEEALVVDVQVAIHTLMLDRGLSRADLARALGVSQARVSQMFSDDANNLTLRTIARIFRVLGQKCRITCDRLEAVLAEDGINRDADAKEAHAPSRQPVKAGFAVMLEFGSRLERRSVAEYGSESNDNNAEVDALAA